MEANKVVVLFCTATNNFYDRKVENRQEKTQMLASRKAFVQTAKRRSTSGQNL